MMDGAPPYGDFPGGPEFDPGAMPDAWEPGPMTDMGPMAPPPGEWWTTLQVIWPPGPPPGGYGR